MVLVLDPRISTETALIAVGVLALVTHQILRYLETYSISAQLLLVCVPPLIGFGLLGLTLPWLSAFCASIVVFYLTLLASVTLYRLSPFHPLARYPGPLACKLTKFWMAWIGLRGDQHLYMQALHERYGDVVRTGPNELSFRDPSLISAMLGQSGVPKGPLMVGRVRTLTNLPLPGIMDTAVHHERRKPWSRAFNAAALKEYEPQVSNRANQLVETLERQKGEISLGEFINYFTYDFMCDMAFGGGSELMREGDKDGIWTTMGAGAPPATFIGHVPWFGLYAAKLPFMSKHGKRMGVHCREFTLRRIQRGSQRKDVFHYLNNEDLTDRSPPPVVQLVNDGILAVIAGADTTSSALTSLFFCLATHPEAFARLRSEVDHFYPPGDNPCDPKHYREMHYLTAVINETLRLYPPVASGTQRQVPHRGQGVMLGPHYVPPGTALYIPPWTLHRDPRNFAPLTTDFWPERWLIAAGRAAPAPEKPAPAAPTVAFVHNDAAFVPFSHGPANCVGKPMALQEMRAVTCALVQKFAVRLRPGWDPRAYEAGYKDFFMSRRETLPVTLHARF
ncbi:high nitrogen upregulated cytochrome P450 monooxygenase 2 [Trametes gibbosa]|nr:high nitrogen upregulated cytochrome P450 monooxygenase 2 [Trametes gibbosa]